MNFTDKELDKKDMTEIKDLIKQFWAWEIFKEKLVLYCAGKIDLDKKFLQHYKDYDLREQRKARAERVKNGNKRRS